MLTTAEDVAGLGLDGVREWERTALERILDATESKRLGYFDGEAVYHYYVRHGVEYLQER